MTRSGEVPAMTLHHRDQRANRIIRTVLLAIVAGCFSQPAGAAGSNPRPRAQGRGATPRGSPAPIEDALNLLRWSQDDVPCIEVVDVRPPQVNVLAEGWIVHNPDGSAQPTIYVAGWSELYRAALADRYRRNAGNLIRLAGVLAHERAHIYYGRNEELGYAAQLTTLEHLHAPELERANVRRALEMVRRRQRGR